MTDFSRWQWWYWLITDKHNECDDDDIVDFNGDYDDSEIDYNDDDDGDDEDNDDVSKKCL